jgi:hypothetical protein
MIDCANLSATHDKKNLLPLKEEKSRRSNTIQNPGARNNIITAYMFGELSLPLMTPVFVDDAKDLALAAPALEGGLIFYLRTLYPNILRAKALRRDLARALSDDPPQRIEQLYRGRLHPRGAHYPQGATPLPPSNLSSQVLPGDLIHPLNTASSQALWLGSHTHIHTSEWPLAFT